MTVPKMGINRRISARFGIIRRGKQRKKAIHYYVLADRKRHKEVRGNDNSRETSRAKGNLSERVS